MEEGEGRREGRKEGGREGREFGGMKMGKRGEREKGYMSE